MALSNRYNFVLKDIQLATSIVVHMKYCIRHILRPKMLFNIFYLSIEYNISVIKLFSYRLFYISNECIVWNTNWLMYWKWIILPLPSFVVILRNLWSSLVVLTSCSISFELLKEKDCIPLNLMILLESK